MKKILVTGGTGFLGSHLCSFLLKKGFYVICVDNNFTGSIDNIKDFKSDSNFEFIRHDVTIPLYIEVDEIYHLACPASPRAYQHNPIKTIKTSIMGTLNMLGLAKRLNIKILLTSTSEIYGDPHVSPQSESYWGNVNTLGPRSCYDEGKRCAETLMMEYYKQHKVQIRIVRIFNTYGQNMDKDDGRVVSNFINQCLDGKDITIYGCGSQTRSFCFVSDTIRALFSVMNSDKIGPFNIGNPNEMTILSLAKKIKQLTESKSNIIHAIPLPENDPMVRKPDITKIQTQLNWNPIISLEEGLIETISYFQKQKEITTLK